MLEKQSAEVLGWLGTNLLQWVFVSMVMELSLFPYDTTFHDKLDPSPCV
jgi:hypothetical protein